jgi:hypothetical protein
MDMLPICPAFLEKDAPYQAVQITRTDGCFVFGGDCPVIHIAPVHNGPG